MLLFLCNGFNTIYHIKFTGYERAREQAMRLSTLSLSTRVWPFAHQKCVATICRNLAWITASSTFHRNCSYFWFYFDTLYKYTNVCVSLFISRSLFLFLCVRFFHFHCLIKLTIQWIRRFNKKRNPIRCVHWNSACILSRDKCCTLVSGFSIVCCLPISFPLFLFSFFYLRLCLYLVFWFSLYLFCVCLCAPPPLLRSRCHILFIFRLLFNSFWICVLLSLLFCLTWIKAICTFIYLYTII